MLQGDACLLQAAGKPSILIVSVCVPSSGNGSAGTIAQDLKGIREFTWHPPHW